jgi:hypothetical protein
MRAVLAVWRTRSSHPLVPRKHPTLVMELFTQYAEAKGFGDSNNIFQYFSQV